MPFTTKRNGRESDIKIYGRHGNWQRKVLILDNALPRRYLKGSWDCKIVLGQLSLVQQSPDEPAKKVMLRSLLRYVPVWRLLKAKAANFFPSGFINTTQEYFEPRRKNSFPVAGKKRKKNGAVVCPIYLSSDDYDRNNPWLLDSEWLLSSTSKSTFSESCY